MIARTFRIAVLALGFCAMTAPLAAQRCGEAVPGSPAEWTPHALPNFSADPINARERALLDATSTAVEQILQKTAWGVRRGFEAEAWWHYWPVTVPGAVRQYEISLEMWCPNTHLQPDGYSPIKVVINPDPGVWTGGRGWPDEKGDLLYVEPLRSQARFGSAATWWDFEETNTVGQYVLFTAGGESPTLPVTREEYLRYTIFNLEGPESAPKTSLYQEWLAGAAERKKALDETIALIAATDPVKAEQTRQAFEKGERENTELLRKAEEDAHGRRLSDPARARLQAMPAAERALPAFIDASLDLVPAGTPNARPIVRRNPAFYRARGASTEVRAVLVWFAPSAPDGIEDLHRRSYREFDWAAIRRLLPERS